MSPHAPHRRTLALTAAALVLLSISASPAVGGPLPDPLVATDGNLLANPSFEVGDFAKHAAVSWSGASLSTLAGQQVRLKFHLDNANLYSYWVS